ncbi:MAG: hypothetical protein FWD52_00420 [Candidatus Bathyarchaeota archaeon]|nr:hypothetical protein [Candidatus Termiticorpusculum sp.]
MTDIQISKTNLDLTSAVKRLETFSDGPIGTFQAFFNNQGGINSLLTAGDWIGEIRVNNAEIMRGYIDDINVEANQQNAATNFQYSNIIGRNIARDLARCTVTYNWKNMKLGDIFKQALEFGGSLITLPTAYFGSGVNNQNSPEITIDVRDMYLFELFEQITQNNGYGYTVNWETNNLTYWLLSNPPSTNVTLTTGTNGNILSIDPNSVVGNSVCNVIKLKGGSVDDHWTERSQQMWTVTNATKSDDTLSRRIGEASIRIVFTSNNSNIKPELHLTFPNFNHNWLEYDNVEVDTCSIYIRCTFPQYIPIAGQARLPWRIYVKDDQGNVMHWHFFDDLNTSNWVKKTFLMGRYAPTTTEADNQNTINKDATEWRFVNGNTFTWRIVDFWLTPGRNFTFMDPATTTAWFDGLFLPSIEAFAMAYDTSSMTKHGRSMIPIYRPDLPHTMVALQNAANTELAMRKDSFEKLVLICTFQQSLRFSGLTVNVLAPEFGIVQGSNSAITYRIDSIRHIAEPGVTLIRNHDAITQLELTRLVSNQRINNIRTRATSNHQNAVNVSHAERIQKLEEYGSRGTGFGTGGTSDGGTTGTEFNGGVVNNPIGTYQHDFELVEGDWGMHDMLFADHKDSPGGKPNDMLGFRLINAKQDMANGKYTKGSGWWEEIFGVLIWNPSYANDANYTGTPGLCVNDHLFVRRDMYLRGQIASFEGALLLYGGENWTGSDNKTRPNIKWGPGNETGIYNPMIWLANATHNGANTATNVNTLEIRLFNPNRDGAGRYGYQYAHLSCQDLTVYGNLKVEGDTVVGGGGIRAGVGRTETHTEGGVTSSYTYVNFQPAYPAGTIPVVTVSIYAKENSTEPVIAKVTNVSNTGFAVATMLITSGGHKHQTGSVSGELGALNPSQLTSRAVGMLTSNGDNHTVGSVLCTIDPGRHPATTLYTDGGDRPNASHQHTMVVFTWIAIPPTQNAHNLNVNPQLTYP